MATKAELEKFLSELADGHTIKTAAKTAGIGRRTLYDLQKKDAAFAERWQLALDEGIEVLEQEARRRAIEGTERPVTIAGERELVREYSDGLLQFLLKAKRPGVYREHFKHEHTGKDDGPIVLEHDVGSDTARAVLGGLAERGLIRPRLAPDGEPPADEVHPA